MPRIPRLPLTILREEARRFGEAFPQVAAQLADLPGDPSVEQTTSGAAYLAATLLDEIDARRLDAVAVLADGIAPAVSLASPAITVLQLESAGDLGAGQLLESRAIAGHSTRWTALDSVRSAPLAITDCVLSTAPGRPHSLSFVLTRREAVTAPGPGVFEAISVYLDAAPEAAWVLRHWLLRNVASAAAGEGAQRTAVPLSFSPIGLAPNDLDVPPIEGAREPWNYVRRYFSSPHRYRLLRMRGLAETVAGLAPSGSVRVEVSFSEPLPNGVAIARGALRANAFAAINLFRAAAEPVRVRHERTAVPLRVAGLPERVGGAYAVAGVRARMGTLDDAVPPLRRMGARAEGDQPLFAYVAVPRARPGPEADSDLVVEFSVRPGALLPLEGVTASIELWATQRAHATRLGAHEVLHGVRTDAAAPASARVLAQPSPYRAAPAGAALARPLLERIALRPLGSDVSDALRSLLFAQLVDANDSTIGRVRAVLEAKIVATKRRTARGEVHRGSELRVAVDESAFEGLGDVALFGETLAATLGGLAAVGQELRVSVVGAKTGFLASWRAA